MSKTTVGSAEIVFSPIGVTAAWMAGPMMNPSVWNNESSATCVVRSSRVVTFEM